MYTSMMLVLALVTCLVQYGACLLAPMKGNDGEPDIDSIINHLTLLEQTVGELKDVKTRNAVLETRLEAAEVELTQLSSKLATCTTDMAVVKSKMEGMAALKDCCDMNKASVRNLTMTENQLQSQVNSLNHALADVYNKSTSNSHVLNSFHGMHDLVTIDGWVLVYRIQADNGISAYSTWMDDAVYHDNPLLPWLVGPECQTLQTSHPCRVHFKSKIVPLWQSVNVQQVKVLLIKNSQVRQQILFDGVGTTKTSWFSHDRIINSTWTDLKTAPYNYFGIKGDDRSVHRRFYANKLYNGCPQDENWMTVIDAAEVQQPGECSWDMVQSIPKIMYSKRPTASVTGTDLHDFEAGDVMAILVKLGDM